ncbi:L-argininosuccinate lyase [Synechocystis sp. PCC 6803]|uniref:Argininosuccinate lyase n=1 Tax=Synechocystis sp. (strain ATCC 27184 / PCC 6803 / Kazusa) TaxID=1111708 RepID=ARLY_SYNY3|nr:MULTISPECIES: argininosuccinate lyase [unclassified Synechocystis]P73257.1 RecName: Full=Argininosuccinate lyase; Short=ASAL; AltName: Full=Arginosuccinase [Synechocystis sp. PCC 6803 substr. Kazusa]BAM51006.1 argininosuccinate lyase [Synechocystis sp. PCC 6803] [Bacillus subtilis BEST7613]AGF50973.1 L-argininosuccinate lyase [Synechocystis sp. PCC 6803]ALJ67017.1 argininosuccinate lyase [Synechocystis sp. PCC 6803]AVP88861.1 argininosuccinate lyase [Synechocystis sp. IPPAS B-1465]MBD26173
MTKKTWSDRFEGTLHPAIALFNASIGFDIELIEYDLDGSIAHGKMLAKTGIISPGEAEQLVQGLEQIRQEYRAGNFNPGVDQEDVHFAVERRLTELVGDVGKKLHTARSRNDQVGTDVRLYLRAQIDDIRQRLRDFQAVLLQLAETNVETLIPGYTHLQRAQPVSLAHHLLAYFQMAQRDWQRLGEIRARTNVSPLGSGALAGTTFPIDRHYSAELLGFAGVYANSLDGVSDRDFAIEFLNAASLIMVHLSRLSEEMILWASQEFSFISLTDSCATGSSIMPQKKNPDVPELIRGKAGRVMGHLQGMLVLMKGLPLAYNKDLQEDKEALFDAVKTVQVSLEAMTILLDEGIVFRQERLAEAVAEDFSNATDVADYLAAKGVPFREAYNLVGKVVKTSLAAGKLLKDLTLAEWQALHPAFEEDIYQAITPQQVVAARNSYGGTGFEQVKMAIANAKAELSQT